MKAAYRVVTKEWSIAARKGGSLLLRTDGRILKRGPAACLTTVARHTPISGGFIDSLAYLRHTFFSSGGRAPYSSKLYRIEMIFGLYRDAPALVHDRMSLRTFKLSGPCEASTRRIAFDYHTDLFFESHALLSTTPSRCALQVVPSSYFPLVRRW